MRLVGTLCMLIRTYIRTYAYIETGIVASYDQKHCCLPFSHSVVRRRLEINPVLHLWNNWAEEADNPLHSTRKTEGITRKLLCLVKKYGHCILVYVEVQYLMATNLDINLLIALADLWLFKFSRMQKIAILILCSRKENLLTWVSMLMFGIHEHARF